MSEHTKTPWHTGGIGNHIVFDSDGYAVANATVFHGKQEDGESAANADHIVKCVNSHDALVDAVKAALKRLEASGFSEDRLAYLCRATLALAEPQPKQGKE